MTDAEVLKLARNSTLTCDQIYNTMKGVHNVANVATVVVSSDFTNNLTVSNVTLSGAFAPQGKVSLSIGRQECLVSSDHLSAALSAVSNARYPDEYVTKE